MPDDRHKGKKPVTVFLEPEIHRQLSHLAIDKGVTAPELIRRWALERLKTETPSAETK